MRTRSLMSLAMLRHQFCAGAHDQIEPAAAGVDRTDLFIRADRGGHRGVQLDASQLGFGFVIVDVVVANRVDFRRITGLAGAQDDAGFGHSGLFPDKAYQLQAGVLLLHHDVEQDHGDVFFVSQNRARFGCRIRMQESQRPMLYFQVAEGERGRRVDVGVVIDDHHAPHACRRTPLRRARRCRLFQEYEIVLVLGARRLHGRVSKILNVLVWK